MSWINAAADARFQTLPDRSFLPTNLAGKSQRMAHDLRPNILVLETDPLVLAHIVLTVQEIYPGAEVHGCATVEAAGACLDGTADVSMAIVDMSERRMADSPIAVSLSRRSCPVVHIDGRPGTPTRPAYWVTVDKPFTEEALITAMTSVWPSVS